MIRKEIKNISLEVLEKLLQRKKDKIGFDMIEPNVIKFWKYDKYCSGKEQYLGIRRLV